jgi:hypothetical protein
MCFDSIPAVLVNRSMVSVQTSFGQWWERSSPTNSTYDGLAEGSLDGYALISMVPAPSFNHLEMEIDG